MLELIRAARDGDGSAMSRLLEALGPRIDRAIGANLFRADLGAASISDLAQEVRLDIARGLKGFRGSTLPEFRSWLERLVRNNIVDARRRVREPRTGSLDQTDAAGLRLRDAVPSLRPSPSEPARQRESIEGVRSALGRLKADHAEVLRLRYLEGKEIAEIAALLGLEANAVHQRIFRAMKALRPHLDGRT